MQLPTPAATQEPALTPPINDSSTTALGASVNSDPTPAHEPLLTPTPSHIEHRATPAQQLRAPLQPSIEEPVTTQPSADELDANRAHKRRRIESPTHSSTAQVPESSANILESNGPLAPTRQENASLPESPQGQVPAVVEAPIVATEIIDNISEGLTEQNTTDDIAPSQTRKRRKLPWVAVNHVQEDGGEATTPAPAAKTRKPTRTRAKKKASTEQDFENVQEQANNDEEPVPPRKRPSAKARGKRTAVDTTEADVESQPPAKKTRKPRKPKANPTSTSEHLEEAGAETAQENGGTEQTLMRRKPRAPKRRKQATTDGEVVEGEAAAMPKRKGRPPREPTPSDAEDQTIDPEITFMDTLASRNIRVGKLSAREKEMRKINWAEVRERRREEDSRPIKSKEEQEAADKLLTEAGAALDQQPEGTVRTALIDGVIQIVPDSGIVDREAEADREIAEYEIIETQDLTSRITSRSFMKNNKRFPNDFVLPGQGKRWNTDSTDLFYQGLKSFGTDFQMISRMFPGSTRRSIKTKFTREERENPERVRAALHGRSEIASHWNVFLEASQLKEESFKDADQIKKELAEVEARMQEQIEAAKAEAAERKHQKRLAGVLDDEEGDDAANKENGKGKKKKREKGKKVAFQEEAGVEILEENIGENDSWFQQQQ